MTKYSAMGQCIGGHYHQNSPNDQPKKRFYKNRNGNLSATFHILDCDLHWDLLNVNIATEEQLMTLPGVNRAISRNIIDYRQAIGGFKKVEDLALVSGVGASKLEHFRSEICVNNRRKMLDSHSSSRNQSLESLLSIETNSRHQKSSPIKVVNVNTANMFQLMTVRSMSQEMAANIIHYRERKGPFKTIDELLKVKCITPQKFSTMRLFLVVDIWTSKQENRSFSPSTPQINPICKKQIHHRRTKSAPPCHSDIKKLRAIDDKTREIYELLSSKCSRPITEQNYLYNKNGRSSFRIGLWNLQCFSVDKAKNPGIREVICRTVLENGLSLIAIHEVMSDDALALINAELNDPQLINIANWSGERGKWQYVVPSVMPSVNTHPTGKHCRIRSGFLLDVSHGLEICSSSSLMLPKEKLGHEDINSIVIGKFKVDKFEFNVVSVYYKQNYIFGKTTQELLSVVIEEIQKQLSDERNIIITGSIFVPVPKKETQLFSYSDFTHLVPEGTSTNLNHNNQENFILANEHMKKMHTGDWGIVREGLSHLAIPNGWLWGGTVGDYCPAWVELLADNNNINSLLANGTCQVPPIPEENCINSLTSQPIKEDVTKKKKWFDSWNRKRKRTDQTELAANGNTILLN